MILYLILAKMRAYDFSQILEVQIMGLSSLTQPALCTTPINLYYHYMHKKFLIFVFKKNRFYLL